MAEVDRLGALQMRVGRHRPVRVALGERQQPRLQRPDELQGALGALGGEQRQVGRHLVVSRAAGVQLAAERPDQLGQPSLDRRVDVLVGVAELELLPLELAGDLVEAAADPFQLLRGDHPRHARAPPRGPSRRGSPAARAACRSRSKR